jgi:hypothetical protein
MVINLGSEEAIPLAQFKEFYNHHFLIKDTTRSKGLRVFMDKLNCTLQHLFHTAPTLPISLGTIP